MLVADNVQDVQAFEHPMTRRGRTTLLSLALAACLVLCWWQPADPAVHAAGNDAGHTATSVDRAAPGPCPGAPPGISLCFNIDPDCNIPIEVLTSGRQIIVRDEKTGNIVPDAKVLVHESRSFPYDWDAWWRRAQFCDFSEVEAGMHSRSRHFATNAHGTTLIPHSTTALDVVAFTDTHWGVASVDSSEPILNVYLRERRPLVIRILHEDGSPAAGCAVLAGAASSEYALPPWISDDTGRVRVAEMALVEHFLRRSPSLFYLPAVPDSPVLTVDAASVSAGELCLTAPASAPMRIRVTGLDALPPASLPMLRAQVRVEGAGSQRGDHLTARIHDGVAVTAALPRGRRVIVRIISMLGELEEAESTVDGPPQSDAAHEVCIPLPPVRPRFTVKLVDSSGSPVRSTRVGAYAVGWFHAVNGHEGTTDGDGVLRGAFCRASRHGEHPSPEEAAAGNRLVVTAAWPDPSDRCLAVCALPVTLAPGINDLGTLTLRAAPILAAGIVRDERGAPMAGAGVRVTPLIKNANGAMVREQEPLLALSRADGSFSVRARSDATHVEVLSADNALARVARHELAHGATSIELKIARCGHLKGRVLLPAGAPARALRVVAESQSTDLDLLHDYCRARYGRSDPPLSSWKELKLQTFVDERGRFEFDCLPPGPVHVYLKDPNGGEALFAQVAGVEIVSGRIAQDARLDPIDLSQLTLFSLSVKQLDGAPLPYAWVICDGEAKNMVHWADRSGRAAFLVLSLPPCVLVRHDGRRDQVVSVVAPEQEVRLSPGIEVHLQLGPIAEGFTVRPWGGRNVEWTFTPLNPDAHCTDLVRWDAAGFPSPVIRFLHPGLWKVQLALPGKEGQEKYEMFTVPLLNDGVINVPDGAGPHQIQITAERGALERYMQLK